MTTWRVLLESLIWGLADVGGLNAKWLPIHRRELAQTHGMGQVLTEWLGGSSVFVIHACESGIHGLRRSGDERGFRRSGDERHDNLAGALRES